MAKDLLELLAGNDLRSLGKSSDIISLIGDQKTFDELFIHLYNQNRAIVMKTIDVIEKITLKNKEYLQKHKSEILKISKNVENIELKWHLAQILARIKYANDEMEIVWKTLKQWILNKGESKIVLVNSLQSLYEIVKENNKYENDMNNVLKIIKQENIASINARIKKLGL